jgi:transketolase
MTAQSGTLDDLCINTIRVLGIDAVEQAASGHPGMPMGAAPMAYVLWTRHEVRVVAGQAVNPGDVLVVLE